MKNLLYLIFGLTLMASCSTPLYIPNATNTPSLLEKGEIEAGGYLGTNGWDLQSAYAINEDFGVMLNGSYGKNQSDSTDTYSMHRFAEIGFVYTSIIKTKEGRKRERNTFFNGIAGYGLGQAEGLRRFSNIFDNSIKYTQISAGDYYRIFLQPGFGSSNGFFEFHFSLRMSYVRFTSLVNKLEWDPSLVNDEGLWYNYYFEPTMTFKIGGENAKFLFQTGASIPQYMGDATAFRNRGFIFIIGFHLNFFTYSKKKEWHNS